MLCIVVLSTACVKEANTYFGLSIGFTVVAAAYAIGWISGNMCFYVYMRSLWVSTFQEHSHASNASNGVVMLVMLTYLLMIWCGDRRLLEPSGLSGCQHVVVSF